MVRFSLCLAVLVTSCTLDTPTPNPDPIIAVVAGEQVHQSLYTLRLTSAQAQVSQAGGPTQNSQMQTKLAQAVFRSLITDAAIAQEAHVLNVFPSSADVAAEVAKDATAAGGTPALVSQAAEAGTSLAGINDQVLSRLTETAVEDHFASQRADYVYGQLRSGHDFATLAQSFSDDPASATKGGDLGTITDTQLASASKVFQHNVNGLFVGSLTEIRESSGYDIIRLDELVVNGKHLSHILVAAPKPYTVRARPNWFALSVSNQLYSYCQNHQVAIYPANMPSPCTSPSPLAGPSAPATP